MIDLPADQLEQVRRIAGSHVGPGQVFAFGSRVNGKARKFSDLDLMIKADDSLNWKILADLRESFEGSDLPITVDVVDWNNCSEDFRRVVFPQLVQIL